MVLFFLRHFLKYSAEGKTVQAPIGPLHWPILVCTVCIRQLSEIFIYEISGQHPHKKDGAPCNHLLKHSYSKTVYALTRLVHSQFRDRTAWPSHLYNFIQSSGPQDPCTMTIQMDNTQHNGKQSRPKPDCLDLNTAY